MELEKKFKSLWYKENIKHQAKRIKDLTKILSEMDKGKKIVFATDIGGKFGGLGYIMPTREWVVGDLNEARENLVEYRNRLKKVI
jgi:hypothetical protein